MLIYKSIIENMSDGVMVIGFNGIITYINDAAAELIGLPKENILNNKFAKIFYKYDENDNLNQLLLDSIYEGMERNSGLVDYFDGTVKKNLYVTTAYLRNEDKEQKAVIVMLSNLTAIRQLEEEKERIFYTFGRYLSEDIVKSLLDSPDGLALGGKKNDVTIMMTDLRGFTTFSEEMKPVDVITMLNNYLGEMVSILDKYQGTVIEFIGDAILAVFGAPKDISNPEDAAAACAVEMQNAMKNVNIFNRTNGFPVIEMGIGINAGIAVLGNIGSEKCTKYSIIGKNVNLCSRIESYTVGGQILVSQSVKDRMTAPLSIRGEVTILPKGIKTPLTVYDIAGVGEPYSVECTDDDNTRMAELPEGHMMNLFRIKSKHVAEEPIVAEIITISERCTEVLIKNEDINSIEKFTDYQLTAVAPGGKISFSDVFCKAVQKHDNQVLLHFTAVNSRLLKFVSEFKK